MNYTERDEKQDTTLEDRDEKRDEANDGGSKHKLPFMPSSDDDSPLGSTDQHSDA